MRFEFATAGRILFGPGVADELPAIVGGLGRRALVVTGRDPRRQGTLIGRLDRAGLLGATFATPCEPTVELVQDGVRALLQSRADVVVAIGGGSAIDAGKAIAALATNTGDPLDYLEVVGRGLALAAPPLPAVAVPTTAGTGSEVTRNAVLGVPERRTKVSLRSPMMLPRVAVVDPDLTLDLTPIVTATSGLDAITQLIEPWVSSRATPFTDALVRTALGGVVGHLRRAFAVPGDREARLGMAYASLVGGIALANAGLGVVHGLAAPIGGLFDAPHGAVCAALLPAGMRVNIDALRARDAAHQALARYREVAVLLTGRADASADDGVAAIAELVADLGIPRLGSYGVASSGEEAIVSRALAANSMKANPVPLTADEVATVLRESI